MAGTANAAAGQAMRNLAREALMGSAYECDSACYNALRNKHDWSDVRGMVAWFPALWMDRTPNEILSYATIVDGELWP